MENKITKITLEDYKTFQSLHICGDAETISKILQYISVLNNINNTQIIMPNINAAITKN
ncbi:MAG: hypothetical protein IPJ81_06570 [Chitinophagaceae bacterium]|nr:hypothetical protein [Chitinophagaceae bacterium]